MGKGDRRTKRGKIWRGTFGKTRSSRRRRPRSSRPAPAVVEAPAEPEAVETKATEGDSGGSEPEAPPAEDPSAES